MAISSTGVKAKILAILKENPMSVSELARRLNKRREFVSGYLESMRNEGKVEVVNVGRSKVYRPKR